MNSYYYLKSNKSLLYLAEIVPSASAENVYSYCALPKRMIRLVMNNKNTYSVIFFSKSKILEIQKIWNADPI